LGFLLLQPLWSTRIAMRSERLAPPVSRFGMEAAVGGWRYTVLTVLLSPFGRHAGHACEFERATFV
jgi:hypothetical protein